MTLNAQQLKKVSSGRITDAADVMLDQTLHMIKCILMKHETAQLEVMAEMQEEITRLRQVCRDAYEVWAGSEGIPEPVYASEAYLYQLLINMRDEVKKGL